jgi:hypothetical protein
LGGERIKKIKNWMRSNIGKSKLKTEITSGSETLHSNIDNIKNFNFLLFNFLIAQQNGYANSPDSLLKQVLASIRNGTYQKKFMELKKEILIGYIKQYFDVYKEKPKQTSNLELAKAFGNLVYLIDPDYSNGSFNNLMSSVSHAWLEYIPKNIKAAKPIKYIPGEVMEKLAIPVAKPAVDADSGEVIALPKKGLHAAVPKSEEKFDPEELKQAKYKYNIAEFCFVLRDYEITDKYLKKVLDTQYLNVDAQNLLIQNSILWSEQKMQRDEFDEGLEILNQIKDIGLDTNTKELINDKIKETTVLHKITLLEKKCPLNEHLVGLYLRKRIGYKKFLKLTYYIFGNIEFHQRLEEIRAYPKKMIYPLLEREPNPTTEELIVQRHERHDELIKELYEWFWNLEPVQHYLQPEIKQELIEKFGEFGSGPVIYFRYISKGQYANIMISKAVALAGQGEIQKAKRELFQTYELTGSKKIKEYLEYLRVQEKSTKSIKKKKKMKKKRN